MSLIKGLPFGILLTWIVASVMGSQGARGGKLGIFNAAYGNPLFLDMIQTFYWSWPLFVLSTGLAVALFWMNDS